MLPMPTLNTYVDPHLVSNTPSRASGIDEETETALRIYGCELIQEAGVLLRLYPYAHGCGDGILHKDCDSYRPQVTMATGQVLFHRFYYRKSFREYDVKVCETFEFSVIESNTTIECGNILCVSFCKGGGVTKESA